jgi:hypothetical protein
MKPTKLSEIEFPSVFLKFVLFSILVTIFVVFNPAFGQPIPTSTITFNSQGGTPVASITQNEGTPVTAPANPTKAGYTFADWVPAVPATMPVNDITCVAQWTPNPNPIAYYPFCGNANDQSGNNINPNYIGTGVTLTTDRFGNANSAYDFDGNSNSYIRMPADMLPTTNRTISLWFYADNITNRPGLFAYGGNGTCGTTFFMGLNISGSGQYQIQGHCNYNLAGYNYPAPPLNNWYHFVVIISGTTQKIYVNGSLKNTTASFSTGTYVTNKDLSLGVITYVNGLAPFTDGNVGYFNGKLDDIRIYNSAISESQILELYNETSTYYQDSDSDGFGNPLSSIQSCIIPTGWVINNTDCNDNDATIFPGAQELCDNKDNDCDSHIDDGILIFTTAQSGSYNLLATWGGCLPPDPVPPNVHLIITQNITNPVGHTITNDGLITISGGTFINDGIYQGNGTFEGDFINNGIVKPGDN